MFHSDFREWMRYELLMTDGDVDPRLKTGLAAGIIFPPELHIPLTRDTADFMGWFYRCGEHRENSEREDEGEPLLESRLPYRFDCDYPYIYAAFKELYGIDLNSVEYLHWWDFKAMFRSLHDCRLTEIMGYRTAELSDMSERMREHYYKMQEVYQLPVSITERRKIEEVQKMLNG